MKVSKLIELLKEQDEDLDVCIMTEDGIVDLNTEGIQTGCWNEESDTFIDISELSEEEEPDMFKNILLIG